MGKLIPKPRLGRDTRARLRTPAGTGRQLRLLSATAVRCTASEQESAATREQDEQGSEKHEDRGEGQHTSNHVGDGDSRVGYVEETR
ncbi:hypothetical protein AB0N62_07460 [Streptomyces sp. NPDC093982]|jgi:protein involved in temperature-dependent protein secretion|uniref:hypothetical protein n=1 Tax=Streptomyces sp. NPDC093982 TaxID=3155077 RepID=UPI00343746E2